MIDASMTQVFAHSSMKNWWVCNLFGEILKLPKHCCSLHSILHIWGAQRTSADICWYQLISADKWLISGWLISVSHLSATYQLISADISRYQQMSAGHLKCVVCCATNNSVWAASKSHQTDYKLTNFSWNCVQTLVSLRHQSSQTNLWS